MTTQLHHYYLQQMGIEPWIIRRRPSQAKIKLLILAENFPFAGKAASLFDNMLKSIGLLPSDIGILSECFDKNTPILVFGVVSAHNLLNSTEPLANLRQKIHTIQGQPVLVSFHPNELLQHPNDKKKAYQDLRQMEQLLSILRAGTNLSFSAQRYSEFARSD